MYGIFPNTNFGLFYLTVILRYDPIFINTICKPDWYLKLNPSGKVPVLRFNGENKVESDALMRFVDEKNGGSSLLNACSEEGFKKALELTSVVRLIP